MASRDGMVSAVVAMPLEERRRAYVVARRWMHREGIPLLPRDQEPDCDRWSSIMLAAVVAAANGNPVVLGIQ